MQGALAPGAEAAERGAAGPPAPAGAVWATRLSRLGQGGLRGVVRLPSALFPPPAALFLWVPVYLSFGIGLWFSLLWEPGAWVYALVAAGGGGTAAAIWLRGDEALRPLAVLIGCVAAGFLASGLRAHLVAGPVLDFRYYGPVTGRIVEIDRSQSDALRLTLDQVVIARTDPDRLPLRVRVSLRGAGGPLVPEPGQVVMMTAQLSAPQGPAAPGAFDFRRMAFFDGLGAIGYTSSPVVLWQEPVAGARVIDRLRAWLGRGMLEAMPGQAGAFATGAMTGDRSAITQETVVALRDSSLAHLLAISGMNMVFLVSFVFALIRRGLALIPPVALRVDAKKLAAAISLWVALFYLLLSGANVATQRAFLMVAVMLVAVLCDRRAISMRSVAISATILLLWQPESLLEPGFQMSFAATVALVAGFGAIDRGVVRQRLPRIALPVFTAVLSSALGGVATAPYAAATFNRFADLGFVANLLTVPAMGMMVMPGGVMAALLAPFGLEAPALWLMWAGAAWILFVAHRIAAVEGAVTAIAAPDPLVIPVLTLGAVWMILGVGRGRWGGVALMVASLALWAAGTPPPAGLVAGDGLVAGLAGAGGRAISVPKGGGFTVRNWLEGEGDLASQAEAAARPGFAGPRNAREFALGGWRAVVLTGKGAGEALRDACARHDLVIAGVIEIGGEGRAVAGMRALLRAGLRGGVSAQAGRGSRAGAEAVDAAARGLVEPQPAGQRVPRRGRAPPQGEGDSSRSALPGRPPVSDGDPASVVSLGRGECLVIDRATLRRSGAIALSTEGEALRLTPTFQGRRIWSGTGQGLPPLLIRRQMDG